MSLDDELRKVRASQDAAMGAKAGEGATREGVLLAGIRAAMDHAIASTDPSLADLEAALGVKLDAGAFLMGMMGAAFAMQGVDLNEAASAYTDLFNEYIVKARQR